MASTPGSNPTAHGGADRSHFHKAVALQDWWLIRVPNDGGGDERLAVAGLDCGGQKQPRRVFVSAPIAKRFDSFSVETEDSIWVLINGFLNNQRTTENGFSPEVVRSFRFGFPPDWEECVPKLLGGDSAPTYDVSENICHSDELASHPGSVESSILTSVRFDQEETSLEQSSKLSRNVAFDNSKVDDLPKPAAEETATDTESSDFQSIDRPKHRGGDQKKPVSRCCTKQKTATSSPASEVIESLGGASGATAQSGGNMDISGEYPSYSARRVSKRKRRFCRKQRAGSRLNSKRIIGDSVSAVSKTVGSTVQNDNCKGGRSMSHPFDSELPELNNVNAVKQLDFQCLEANLQPACKAKQGQNGENIPGQGGGKEDSPSCAETNQTIERTTIASQNIEEDPKPIPSTANTDSINWRKYGQKLVRGRKYRRSYYKCTRSYYKCTHSKCPAKKVERSLEGLIVEIVYKGEHNHSSPQPPKHSSSRTQGVGAASDGTSQDTNNWLWNSHLNERNEGSEGRVEDQNEVGAPVSSYQRKAPLPHDHLVSGGINAGGATSDNSCGLSGESEKESEEVESEEYEPRSKRRKSETQSSEAGISGEGVQDPHVVVQSYVESDMTGDGFFWRKFWGKVVKGNPYPRSYYRCTSFNCRVRKYVERVSDDPKAFITTYRGKHNHDMPLRNSSPAASEKDTQATTSKENP